MTSGTLVDMDAIGDGFFGHKLAAELKMFDTDGMTCDKFVTLAGELPLPPLSPDHWTMVFKLATGTSSVVMSLNQLLATVAWVGDARAPHPSLKKYIEVAFCQLFVAPEEKSDTLSSWKPIRELMGVTTREEALKIFQYGNALAFLTGTDHSVWYIFADTKNDKKVTCTKLLFEYDDKIVEEELPRFSYTKRGQVPDARVKFSTTRQANLTKNEPLLAEILARREKQRLEFLDEENKNKLVEWAAEPIAPTTFNGIMFDEVVTFQVPVGRTEEDAKVVDDLIVSILNKEDEKAPAIQPSQTHIMADLWDCAEHGSYRINTGDMARDMTVPGCPLCGLEKEKAASA